MKAVGVLFGFLGFSNFIFFYNHQDQGFWEAAYLLTNSISQSSQVIKIIFLSRDWITSVYFLLAGHRGIGTVLLLLS